MNKTGILKALLALLALTFLLAGCGGKPDSMSTIAHNLDITMWVSNSCPRVGDTVKFRATVKNFSNETFRLDARDKPAFDILLGTKEKQIHWSDGKPLTRELTQLQLAPGASKSIEMDLTMPQDRVKSATAMAIIAYNPPDPYNAIGPAVTINGGNCVGFGW